ncbi:MAG: GIY-YIG nuclease family protein [Candidatus Omnitrophota bacterium]
MHYVYVLFGSKDDKFYIGYTQNLQRRINEHNEGSNHTTVRYNNPQLIFCETFICKGDALRREKYFKTTKGRKALRLILRNTLTHNDNNCACPVV